MTNERLIVWDVPADDIQRFLQTMEERGAPATKAHELQEVADGSHHYYWRLPPDADLDDEGETDGFRWRTFFGTPKDDGETSFGKRPCDLYHTPSMERCTTPAIRVWQLGPTAPDGSFPANYFCLPHYLRVLSDAMGAGTQQTLWGRPVEA